MTHIMDLINTLDAAYKKYFDEGDGYSKSSDGGVSVTVDYGTYNHRSCGRPITYKVEVWSYVFGPSRQHTFVGSTEEEALSAAIDEVKSWIVDEEKR